MFIIESTTPTPPSSADSGLGRRKNKRRKPKNYVTDKKPSPISPPSLHNFPKPRLLPAVGESYPKVNGDVQRTDSSR